MTSPQTDIMRLFATSLVMLAGLRAPAGDAPETESGTPAPAPAAEAPPAAPAEPPKPGIIATATALLKGSQNSAATIAGLRADLTSRDATITQLQADLAARDTTITTLQAEIATFRQEEATLQETIRTLETTRVNTQTEVIHQLAAAGMPEASLPKSSAPAAIQETAEDLWAAAEKEPDPVKKGALASRALALTAPKKPHGAN